MTKILLSRRSTLSLISAFPFAVPLAAQDRPASIREVFASRAHALILEPAGRMLSWTTWNGGQRNDEGEFGLGHNQLVEIDPIGVSA